jgi:choice-of-anchor C domain-containing protein
VRIAALANLIVNGSFEDAPDFKGAFRSLNEGATDIKGWVVTRAPSTKHPGQIDLTREWQAADGKQSLDLHGTPGFGGVKQQFATRVGHMYRLTFSMSGHPHRGNRRVQMAVRAAGQKQVFECDIAGRNFKNMTWENKTWTFTATGEITLLEFYTAMADSADPFGGPALDDVKVIAIDQ